MANHYSQIMFTKLYFIILMLFCFSCRPVFGKLSEQKSSLTFVIDETNSMKDDIGQVRAAAKSILNTVLESKASRIGNFVLVRFNDPDVKPAFITTKKEDYIKALDDIVLLGNMDCPEMAMKGIGEALIKGLPRSYVFVFTDASAKDYKDFERIKRIAQEKSSQIIFVLTGLCSTEDDPAYLVYHELAKATSGQVFHLEKNELNKILQYVAEIVKAPRTVLAEKQFGPGSDNRLSYLADGKIRDVIVAITGKTSRVEVLDSRGEKAKTKVILETTNIKVIMIISTEQGRYTVILDSITNTKVIITGATAFDFTYGFSPFRPAVIDVTTPRPIAGKPSYLAIELDNPDNDVELNEVYLMDIDNNVLQVLPLNKVNEDFYLTEPIIPPNSMFKILVKGFIKGTKIPVERISATPIQPENPEYVLPKLKETVTKVEVRRFESFSISCIVTEGWPQPKIRWFFKPQDSSDFTEISETSEVMYIPSAKEGNFGIYRCEAYNAYGSAVLDVTVVILTPPAIKEDETTVSTKSGKFIDLHCVVSGYPTPKISWTFNGGKVETTHVAFRKTNTLRIRASLKNAGHYTCEAVNVLGVAKKTIQVIVNAPPKIIVPAETTIEKSVGCPLTLSCETTGFPKPFVQWKYYNYNTIATFLTKGIDNFFADHIKCDVNYGRPNYVKINYNSSHTDASGTLHLPELTRAENGYYVCVAENSYGSDKINYTVKVLSPSAIVKSLPVNVEAFIGESGLELQCQATGNPKPTIAWTKDGVYIPKGTDCDSDTKYGIKDEGTLVIDNIDHLSSGTFTCVARNKVGVDVHRVNVIVLPSPRPDKWDKVVNIEVGITAKIICHMPHGPTDVVTWYKESKVITTGELILNNPQLSDKGLFTCKVNAGISASILVQVGFKPKFIDDVNKDVGFFLDEEVRLSCVAQGEHILKVSWKHNGHPLNVEAMFYTFKMSEAAQGKYTCAVSNTFGTITRDFNVHFLF